jgi:PAS domain S-box-containing protein
MHFASNPGFHEVAFIEASATLVLLVLYFSLYSGSRLRCLRYWIAGWSVYTLVATVRAYSLFRGGSGSPRPMGLLGVIATAFFLAAALDYSGDFTWVKHVWTWLAMAVAIFIAEGPIARLDRAESWSENGLYCLISILAAYVLWRARKNQARFGVTLLAGALLLRGLHAIDRPEWQFEPFGLYRAIGQSVLAVGAGVAMVILVVETGRARTHVLNEKLRRLALITSEATHSLNLNDALEGILRNLLESLGSEKGCVYLLDEREQGRKLGLRSSVGLSEKFKGERAQISAQEVWVLRGLQRENPVSLYKATADPVTQEWMQAEGLGVVVLARVEGKDRQLGLLGIAFGDKHHADADEEQFLGNVANLLGLTVQNISLFESAATSRKQWRDIFDSIEEMIFVHAPDGRILRTNRPFATRVEFDPAALIGRKVRDVLSRGAALWEVCPYCEGIAGKGEQLDPSFGAYLLAMDSAFCDSSGERLGTIHVLKDFTIRRQAENRFRDLFERGREGVFIATPEGRFLDFNESFMRMLGYENRQELLDEDLLDTLYVNPQDRKRLQNLLRDFGEVTDFEFQFRRRDGEIRTGQESSFLTRDDSGNITGYQGFLLDVTEHKQAEFDIRRRNRELLALNAIAGLLSQSTTIEEGITGALLKLTELFAADVSSVHLLDEQALTLQLCASMGGAFREGGTGSVFQISSSLLDQIRQTHALLLPGSALPDEVREVLRRSGIQLLQVAVLWAKERIIGILILGSREIREFSPAQLNLLAAIGNQIAGTIDKTLLLKQTRDAYDTLRQTQEQLLQSEKMAAVGQLIAGVAHELNNPLTAILGYSQLLSSTKDMPARSTDYVEKLFKQAQRTHHIVQSLLSFARQHKPERTSVQLNRIIEDTLVLREYDMKRGGIVIHRELDPTLPPTGGDFHQLQQVFLNIVNNAVDAVTELDGVREIWITTRREGKQLLAEFTDSGPGVKDPSRVFDPFFTTKPVGKGTGLGLSICYGIVKEHGGEIRVKNSPPRGATFTVTLPLVPVATLPRVEENSTTTGSAIGKVLLVEGEEPVLQLEQELLQRHNVSVRVARNARDAMHVLQAESVDAVVLEVESPDQASTMSLYSWIRQNQPDLASRVIFTAATNHPGTNEMIQSTKCLLLTKPFEIDAFWEAVRSLLVPDYVGSPER